MNVLPVTWSRTLPGAPDGFDAALHILLRESVGEDADRALAGRIVAELGRPIDTGIPELRHVAPDAFPASDPRLQWCAGSAGARALHAEAEQWRPRRGYAACHLWLQDEMR
jgi:3-methyladenine DNA glycosylase/8-oxoguanine DNA glycosylase